MSEIFTSQFGPVSSHVDLRYALWHLIEGQKRGDFDRRDGAQLRILATDAALRAENEQLRAAATEALAVLARLADDPLVPVGLVADVDAAKARLAGVLRG